MKALASALTALLLTAISIQAAESPVSNTPGQADLKVKWPIGKKIVQEFKMQMDNEIPLGGQTMLQKMEMVNEYSIDVTKGEGDKTVLEMEFLDQSMLMSMNGNTIISAGSGVESIDASGGLGDFFTALKGSKLKAYLNAQNDVEKLEGLEDLKESVSKKVPAQMAPIISQQFSEAYYKQMFRMGDGLPNKTVKIGDSWPFETELETGAIGKLKQKATYTFKGWQKKNNRNCALLEFTGTLEAGGGEVAGAGGVTVKMDTSAIKGKSWFDPALGIVSDSATEVISKMQITVPGSTEPVTTNAKQLITVSLASPEKSPEKKK